MFEAGADVFRLNCSHGSHADHRARHGLIRDIEREAGRLIVVLLDRQGPKLRIGGFADGSFDLEAGRSFRLDLGDQPGDRHRVRLPHPEIFDALRPGTDLLVDDGKVRLRVRTCGDGFAEIDVVVAGRVSDHQGVNVPSVRLLTRIRKRIVRSCRAAGKPVIVATQMLELMTASSVPTRAEASDVATAGYDGADAVMLSRSSTRAAIPRFLRA
jgi:pyruvate kinase